MRSDDSDARGLPEGGSVIQIDVFDPPMRCSTSTCGPAADPLLAVRLADEGRRVLTRGSRRSLLARPVEGHGPVPHPMPLGMHRW